MKILIELPTWLGDAVMATPAIKNLIEYYKNPDLTLIGSNVSIDLLKKIPQVKRYYIDSTKDKNIFNRIKKINLLAKEIGEHDIAVTFRNSFFSAYFLKKTGSNIVTGNSKGFNFLFFNKKIKYYENVHQVEKYSEIVNQLILENLETGDLTLPFEAEKFIKKTIGLNPGAAYGSAKRWYPEKFAEVAVEMSKKYDVVIFGGPNEIEMANDIEKILIEKKIKNYTNLAGKTDIKTLVKKIAGLSMFVTNDSGPMHIAAAYKVPTVCIFGPTDYIKTCQWKNPYSAIISKGLKCSPCQKRVCPLKHHLCMKKIEAKDVIKAINNLEKSYNKDEKSAKI